jgi:uncharacterized membrane protein
MNLPPIHPAIVHFPIALIIVAFFADLFGRKSARPSVRNFGFGCLILALCLGVLTLLAGYYDMTRLPLSGAAHDYVHIHMYSGLILAVVLIALTFWRWRIFRSATNIVGGGYLALCFVLLALTLFQGWYGGELVYSEGVGVAADNQSTETAAKAQHRLAAVSRALTGHDFEAEDQTSMMGSPARSQSGSGHSH